MQKPNILVVDDEVHIRLSLRMILQAQGYVVRVAESGAIALAEIREELPQILICDLFMPGMSGFELLNLVRAQYPSIRSIAMCAMFSDDEIPTGVAADAFYRKGANLDFLLATVRMIAPVAPADPAQPFNNLQPESMANDELDSPQAEPIRLRKQAGS